jgi:acyl-CoA synthetase (AMP-forming)/AMP-acid ligase II
MRLPRGSVTWSPGWPTTRTWETSFKCTAGLHNAVRHTGQDGFEHHGFLNVLVATRLLFDGTSVGEVVKAVVVPAAGAVPGPDLERELIEHVRDRIAHVKAPRSVDFVDELPRTPTGKLVKRRLQQKYR